MNNGVASSSMGGLFIGNLMMCVGHCEIKPPIYKKLIEREANVYILMTCYKMHSCVYTKLFLFNMILASTTYTIYTS